MYENKSNKNLFVYIALILISVTLLAMSYTGISNPLKRILVNILIPLQTSIYELRERSNNNGNHLLSSNVTTINATLTAENATLKSENIKLNEALYERDMLAQLLNYTKLDNINEFITANVIGKDSSNFLQYIIIDAGTTTGAQRGMPVVTNAGLIGIINEATPRASKVLLINSNKMAINVKVQESRADGVLFGQASKDLRLNYVELDDIIESGNTIVTSGLGGSLPANIPIGEIASVRSRAYDVFQEADVIPFVDLNKIEIVLIITNFTPADLAPLLNTQSPEDF
ncbi:MAG TPA: rod shape-determining protein MreC [Chloroflexi bacterium]|nr:rod shape-determining protein MreC [Chloroflexota bacterium]HCU98732.1 rod shape-determining protein MreC [Chloroflexota bacterium]